LIHQFLDRPEEEADFYMPEKDFFRNEALSSRQEGREYGEIARV
jgi:hypothetical protein